MGILQSPAFLGLCREDLAKDIEHQILKYVLQYASYLDDLQAGNTRQELSALQQSVNLEELTNINVCSDTMCCSTTPIPLNSAVGPVEAPLGPLTPEDELRACRHLMQGPFGKQLST